MKKKLPNLYVNKIDKKLTNNENIFYSAKVGGSSEVIVSSVSNNLEPQDVVTKINELFNSPNYVYKMNVNITLKDRKTINTDVIGQVGNQLITIDEDAIDINDILDIRFN